MARRTHTLHSLSHAPVVDFGTLGRNSHWIPSLLDMPNRVMTRSGRSALLGALSLSGVTKRDRVLVPTYHCPTMIAPVERLAAIPTFYPLSQSGEPNLEFLEAMEGPLPRAMLVPHLFGLQRHLITISAFCRSRGIVLIEDCAHCFFGSVDEIAVGTTGEYAIGSLAKFFPVVQGGVLVSSSKILNSQVLPPRPLSSELRAVWDILDLSSRTGRLGMFGALTRKIAQIRREQPRADAAPGSAQTEPSSSDIRLEGLSDPLLDPARARRVESWIVEHSNLGAIVDQRRRNYRAICNGLVDIPRAKVLFPDCGPRAVPYVVPLLIAEPDEPYAKMRQSGLPVFRWDRIWPDTPQITGDAAATWARGVVQIACHQSLLDNEITRIVDAIRCCLN